MAACFKVKALVEAKLSRTFPTFTAYLEIHQLVAGMNYIMKVGLLIVLSIRICIAVSFYRLLFSLTTIRPRPIIDNHY